MDALVGAGVAARDRRAQRAGEPVRVVLVPTAVARHRPDLAAAHGRAAFEGAATRAGVALWVEVASLLRREDASDHGVVALLEAADLVHCPGGDPDLLPAVLAGSPAWGAVLRAYGRGACVAGASAGAMALAERLWTRDGPVAGLGLVPGIAVLPHFDPRRSDAWRGVVDPDGRLAWVGLDEQTLILGRPGGSWVVAGAGRAHLLPAGSPAATVAAGPGEAFPLPS